MKSKRKNRKQSQQFYLWSAIGLVALIIMIATGIGFLHYTPDRHKTIVIRNPPEAQAALAKEATPYFESESPVFTPDAYTLEEIDLSPEDEKAIQNLPSRLNGLVIDAYIKQRGQYGYAQFQQNEDVISARQLVYFSKRKEPLWSTLLWAVGVGSIFENPVIDEEDSSTPYNSITKTLANTGSILDRVEDSGPHPFRTWFGGVLGYALDTSRIPGGLFYRVVEEPDWLVFVPRTEYQNTFSMEHNSGVRIWMNREHGYSWFAYEQRALRHNRPPRSITRWLTWDHQNHDGVWIPQRGVLTFEQVDQATVIRKEFAVVSVSSAEDSGVDLEVEHQKVIDAFSE